MGATRPREMRLHGNSVSYVALHSEPLMCGLGALCDRTAFSAGRDWASATAGDCVTLHIEPRVCGVARRAMERLRRDDAAATTRDFCRTDHRKTRVRVAGAIERGLRTRETKL
jgi:hypothetical protein